VAAVVAAIESSADTATPQPPHRHRSATAAFRGVVKRDAARRQNHTPLSESVTE